MNVISNALFSQSIIGEWHLVKFDIDETQISIPTYEKKNRIKLSFDSNHTYEKVFYEFNPFDNFRSELPDINTEVDKIKRVKNKKIKVYGDYIFDKNGSLILFRNEKKYEYLVQIKNNELIIRNVIFESKVDSTVIIQFFIKL